MNLGRPSPKERQTQQDPAENEGGLMPIKSPEETFSPGLEEVHLKPRTRSGFKEYRSTSNQKKPKFSMLGTQHIHRAARDKLTPGR